MSKLNNIIGHFVNETKLLSMDEFNFISRLIQIFEANYKEIEIPKYTYKVPLGKSYRYSYDFLKSINPEYAGYLEKAMINNKLKFVDKKALNKSYTDIEEGKNVIYISLCNTIEDSYDITHEIIHDMTLIDDISYARNMFCEAPTYFMEELQYEYFKEQKNIKEYQINSMKNLAIINQAQKKLMYDMELIKNYLDKGSITAFDIMMMYEQTDNKKLYMKHLQEIVKSNSINLSENHRCIVGILIAYYMLDRVHQDKKKINEILELNEKLNDYNIVDFLDYLDLEYTDDEILNLTENSYKKLENSFVRILKNR